MLWTPGWLRIYGGLLERPGICFVFVSIKCHWNTKNEVESLYTYTLKLKLKSSSILAMDDDILVFPWTYQLLLSSSSLDRSYSSLLGYIVKYNMAILFHSTLFVYVILPVCSFNIDIQMSNCRENQKTTLPLFIIEIFDSPLNLLVSDHVPRNTEQCSIRSSSSDLKTMAICQSELNKNSKSIQTYKRSFKLSQLHEGNLFPGNGWKFSSTMEMWAEFRIESGLFIRELGVRVPKI